MLKITGEKLGYPVYENNNYGVLAYEKRSGAYGIEIEYNGRCNVQTVTIYSDNGEIVFNDYPSEALPKYVVNKVYTLAEKIKKDGNHIPLNERE